jgi:prevent-host-death family protein
LRWSTTRRWRLQDVKARFSELVRRARSHGPQHVTVRGRDEVVIVAAEEFHRLRGDRTGAVLGPAPITPADAAAHATIRQRTGLAPLSERDVISHPSRSAEGCRAAVTL